MLFLVFSSHDSGQLISAQILQSRLDAHRLLGPVHLTTAPFEKESRRRQLHVRFRVAVAVVRDRVNALFDVED
jgi:hypothetical protein